MNLDGGGGAQGGSNLGFRVDFLSVLRHLEGARDIMPGAAVSAACGLPSPRTDLETDVGASPHAKPSGTKRPAALVTPSPPPKRSKGSHGSPQQETDDSAGDSSPLSALSDEKPTPQALRHAARDKRKALHELKTTGCGLFDGETVAPPATANTKLFTFRPLPL